MKEDYCYIDDALKGKFKLEKIFKPEEYPKLYEDADYWSKKLYNDLLKVYGAEDRFGDNLSLAPKEDLPPELLYKGIRLGSDYIGPSRYWAAKIGILNLEIGKYLEKTRRLGGHMLWPRVGEINSINPCRSGSKGYYDRIDCTLLELKLWYKDENEKYKLRDAFNASKGWLINEKIKDFPDFVKVFHFEDYVDENNEVYDLISKEKKLLNENALNAPRIKEKEEYKNYIKNSEKFIENRTKRMLGLI